MLRTTWKTKPSMHGGGKVTFEAFEEDGKKVCGIYKVKGRLKLPPKLWLAVMRGWLAEIETKAKAIGFDEVRMSGRDWGRVFPDYEPMNGTAPNLLRKRL